MNYPMRLWFCSLLLLPMLAWAGIEDMARVLQQTPVPDEFSFCWGGTCAAVETVSLSNEEWQQVRQVFAEPAGNAEAERAMIAQAVGLLERLVGPKTGTDGDRAGTFGNSAYPGQLDCNDESTNTLSYMRMMADDGLIRLHQVISTTTRGGFLIFGRHTTAVIQDITTGRKYAVDAWFHDNGFPPEILPLELWLGGWRPGNSTAH